MESDRLHLNHQFAMTAHLHFRTTVCRHNDYGIGEGQPKVLFALRDEDGQSQSELARHFHLEPASVTALLGRMQRSGLIERRADKQDLRVTRVFLSEAGRAQLSAVDRINAEVGDICFEGFSEEECQQVSRFFERMRDNMERAQTARREGESR